MTDQASENLRLFFALWPDDTTRSALMRLQTNLNGRIVPYSNLHMTLAFLGQQPAQVMDTCKDILLRLRAQPSLLTLDRLGYFSRNRVAWAGVHEAPAGLTALHDEIADALAERGISARDQQTFKPHVTLARDAATPGDISFAPVPWRAAQVALVKSAMLPSGSAYEVLALRSLDERIWIPDS